MMDYKRLDVEKYQIRKWKKYDDAIIKVTSTAICGSDLYLVHGLVKCKYDGFVLGHAQNMNYKKFFHLFI